MWNRFTKHARAAVSYSQEEAQKFGQSYVSTEHLLLGLCRDRDSTAAVVLTRLGLRLMQIRIEVESALAKSDVRPSQDMTLTPRAKRVIDIAYDEAVRLQNTFIGSEHLLLGLIREGEGLAARILTKLGLELEAARRTVREVQEAKGIHPAPKDKGAAASQTPDVAPMEASQNLVAFLGGHCLPHHLMLSLIADPESLTSKVVKAQWDNLSQLQTDLWQAIVAWSGTTLVAPEPEALTMILQIAQQEADTSPILPKHILLALLQDNGSQFSAILSRHGITQDKTRELIAELEGI